MNKNIVGLAFCHPLGLGQKQKADTTTGYSVARVMLDYDPDQNGVAWRLAPSVTNPEQETIIRVFPNPAKEILFVEVMSKTDNYKANMQVYNSMGQLVAEQQLSQKLEYISLDKLKTGMYFYTIQYNNGYTENGKFLIQQ